MDTSKKQKGYIRKGDSMKEMCYNKKENIGNAFQPVQKGEKHRMDKHTWQGAMLGLVTGDALGNPVQFLSREDMLRRGPVTGMEAGGAYNTPAGTWTDDSSMALASMASIRKHAAVIPQDLMERFVAWETRGEYTPFGSPFDEGSTCLKAIYTYRHTHDASTCGMTGEYANGNGALMRILPVCLFHVMMNEAEQIPVENSIRSIDEATALTHNHQRAKIASAIYYFLLRGIYLGAGTLRERVAAGLREAHDYYAGNVAALPQLMYFGRMFDPEAFAALPEEQIRSGGYVVETLEAAVWCLLNTSSYRECLLKAVNLAYDADTTGAVAGGLAGLYYGYDAIPAEWLGALQRRVWVEELCGME